jgi:Mn2+/Fe2+ NRAMP family transporter
VLGTTISPYLFFWQASEEAEDEHGESDARPLREHAQDAPAQTRRIRLDTYAGMIFSNMIALAIMFGSAATLHASGHSDVASAADAAAALKPIAGAFASAIFSLGIIATGLLAVPVLAGSAAYAVGEAYAWTVGLSHRALEARLFYSFIALATALGAGIVFLPISPMKALFWSAVINGAVSAPMIALMVYLGSRPAIMGTLTLPLSLKLLGAFTALLMGACTLAMLFL